MMKSRKWLSLLLAAVITTVNCIPALASWEDGFVIPGQESGGNDSSYDDIFWGNDYDDQITIGNGSTEDVAFDTDDDSDETTNDTENSGQMANSPPFPLPCRPSVPRPRFSTWSRGR